MSLLVSQFTQKELNLGGQNRVVDAGQVSNNIREALVQALATVPNLTTVTVILCTGDKPQATPKQAVAASEEISRNIGEILPRLIRSTVARQATTQECPTGARVALGTGDVYGQGRDARVVALMGEVAAQTKDGRSVQLFKNSVIPEKSDIVTQEGARCTVQLPDGTRVVVRENSRLNLQQLQTADGKGVPRLKLLAGTFWSRFTKLVGGNELEVETPNAIAGVRGTDFQMEAGKESGSLAVYHGQVGVAAGGRNAEVPEGYAVVVAKTLGNVRPLPAAPENLLPRDGKFKTETRVRWDKVDGAVGYRFELARDITFSDLLVQTNPVGTLLKVSAAPGKYFWRVMSRDANNIESKPSKIYAIEFE